ncbi:hypothetical protein BH18ACI4_BH18ACI4_22990 [soil metagenome]
MRQKVWFRRGEVLLHPNQFPLPLMGTAYDRCIDPNRDCSTLSKGINRYAITNIPAVNGSVDGRSILAKPVDR